MFTYMLRIYVPTGDKRGTLDHEEIFHSCTKAKERYREIVKANRKHPMNPTMWTAGKNGWDRVIGF